MPGIWIHADPSLAEAAARARVRSLTEEWSSGSTASRADEFRALLADTCWSIGVLTGEVRLLSTDGESRLEIDLRTRPGVAPERLAASRALYRTTKLLRSGDGGGLRVADVTTVAATDTGALPAVAVVAIVAIGAVAVGYCAHQAATIVDRQLSRVEATRRLLQAHAKMLELVDAHQQREVAAGGSLPLDAASKQALSVLGTTQTELARTRETPLDPFIPVPLAQGVGTGLGWAVGLLPVAAVGLVLYFWR